MNWQRDMRRLIRLLSLLLLLSLIVPVAALAEQPSPPDPEPSQCILCHQVEFETWTASPHAAALDALVEAEKTACSEQSGSPDDDCGCLACHTTDFDPSQGTYSHAGVTCEACHGSYVADHPQNGVMQLAVDATVCSQCHGDTFAQWQGTGHGQAGVACTACHLTHSQQLRLPDDQLCASCHRQDLEDSGHQAHAVNSISCDECHSLPAESPEGLLISTTGARSASHDFAVRADACAGCHDSTFHVPAQPIAFNVVDAAGASAENCGDQAVPATTQDSDLSTLSLAAIALGLGIGIGALMGVVVILTIGFVSQGRARP